jgi:hypothetical protein
VAQAMAAAEVVEAAVAGANNPNAARLTRS